MPDESSKKENWLKIIGLGEKSIQKSYYPELQKELDEKTRAEARLRESEEKFRAVFNMMNDGVFIHDAETLRILEVNSKIREIFLCPEDIDVKSLAVSDLSDVESGYNDEEAVKKLKQTLESGSQIFEWRARRMNGEFLWVENSTSVAVIGGKKYILVAVRDIDEKKKHQIEILKAKEEAEAANRAKADFLSKVSHEFRTPLYGIIGMNALLLARDFSPDVTEYLHNIEYSSRILSRLVDDILDYAETRRSGITLSIQPVKLSDVVIKTVSIMRPFAEAKNLELEFRCDEASGDVVDGDEIRIHQIVDNLVSNAIRYSEKGKISVNLSSEHLPSEKRRFTIEVSDTGMGIDESDLRNIFSSFDQSRVKQFAFKEGLGLGLSVVSAIVDAMGGKLSVESRKGEGSRFTVVLDLAYSAGRGDAVKNDVVEAGFRGMRALVVEDDAIINLYLCDLLSQCGFQVESKSNGLHAFELMTANRYDICILDIGLPGKSGVQIAKDIRLLEGGGERRLLLAMTAYTLDEDIKNYLDSGFDGFLKKPVEESELVEKLSSMLLK